MQITRIYDINEADEAREFADTQEELDRLLSGEDDALNREFEDYVRDNVDLYPFEEIITYG